MRTLPAILLAAFVALVIIASAVLTTQFGMRDWPTPPVPDTATRLVTPTEAAGRAAEKAKNYEQASDDTGPTAYSGGGSGARKPREAKRGTGERPSRPARPSGRSAHEPRAQTPAPSTGDASTETDEGTDAAPAPAPSAPVPVTDGPPVVDGGGEDAQARPQDEPVQPEAVQPAIPDTGDADDAGDPESGHRHGPIRNALENLLTKP